VEVRVHQREGQALAWGCLVVAMALWGSSFIALKLAFTELPPMWVIFGRMALGSLVFLLAWRWRGRIEYRAGDWKYLLGLAACEPCLYFIFEALALQRTSASQAGMITALLPLLVAVGAYLTLRERITRTTLAGFLLAVVGAVWLSLAGDADEHAPAPLLGNFFEFLAMLCATGYTLLLKHLSSRYSAFALTALQAFVGSLFFLPLALFNAGLPAEISTQGWGAVVYLGIVVTVGAYGLYNFGVGRLPASQASGFTNLIPVFTLLMAVLFLGERLNAWQLLAVGLVFIGVGLSQWRRDPSVPTPAGILD
jgi:drug/metabolite transporter (DMT)-like permease